MSRGQWEVRFFLYTFVFLWLFYLNSLTLNSRDPHFFFVNLLFLHFCPETCLTCSFCLTCIIPSIDYTLSIFIISHFNFAFYPCSPRVSSVYLSPIFFDICRSVTLFLLRTCLYSFI